MATTSRNSSKSFNEKRSRRGRGDGGVLLCAWALMGIGLILVYSASFIFAYENYGDGLYFFKRQLIYVGLALVALAATAHTPYLYIKKFFWPLFGLLLLALGALYVPGLGHRVGGALRWINLPLGFHAEPSEIVKLMSPVIFAYLLSYERKSGEPWYKIWVLALLVVVTPVLLLLRQPDFGSAFIFILTGLTLLFCFGLPWRYLVACVLIALPTLYFLVMRVDYRRARVLAFLNPWADPSKGGFQVIQSLLGIHSGGFWGTGLGKGQAKLFFLPEAHTDFILAVLGEEGGFLGFFAVLSLFAWLIFRGLQIGAQCSEPFGRRLAIGLSSLIAYQAFINTGVVLGLLPTKGLTMPFLSFGGSSLIAVSLACGVLLSIHRYSSYASRGAKA